MKNDQTATGFTIDHLLNLRQVASRVPMDLSPDGRWLCVSVRQRGASQPVTTPAQAIEAGVPDDIIGCRALVADATTGEVTEPFPQASISCAGRWSPDGSRLAAYVQHEGPVCLGVWNAYAHSYHLIRDAAVTMSYGFEVPHWTPDSRSVVVKLRCTSPVGLDSPVKEPNAAAKEQVTVFRFDPDTAVEEPPATVDPWSRGDVGVVDVDTGDVRRLVEGWEYRGWRVAPTGESVAVLRMVDHDDVRQQHFFDLMVVPLDGSAPRRVAARITQSYGIGFSWSPDGQQLAYTTRQEGQPTGVWVAPADASLAPYSLTGEESLPMGEHDGVPQWSRDGQRLYYVCGRRLWEWSLDGSFSRMITAELPDEAGGRKVKSLIQSPLSPLLWTLGDGSFLSVTYDPLTRREGLGKTSPVDGCTTMIEEFEHINQDWGFAFAMAADGSACYFNRESCDCAPEIWSIHTDSLYKRDEVHRVVCLNPSFGDISLGEGRLIDWQDSTGETRYGALLLPPGHVEGQRLPLLTEVYGDYNYSDDIHHFGFHSLPDYDNAHLWTSQGFAVLCPDQPMNDGNPLRQMANLILPAVDRVIELGIADPDRLGLMGHSYGGYGVLAILTQTTRFRAALCHSGAGYNFTSYYGCLDEEGNSSGLGWCEGDQPCLNGTLWEKRDTYIENSPLFYLDRVRTPVLLVGGAEDVNNTLQAKEVFSGLRRLGQRVELCLYHGEGHCTDGWSERNLRDVNTRMLQWFDTFLKPADASPIFTPDQ